MKMEMENKSSTLLDNGGRVGQGLDYGRSVLRKIEARRRFLLVENGRARRKSECVFEFLLRCMMYRHLQTTSTHNDARATFLIC